MSVEASVAAEPEERAVRATGAKHRWWQGGTLIVPSSTNALKRLQRPCQEGGQVGECVERAPGGG